uniref:DUF987 family protein n=1 Tax=Escherichia coli TaxID=562 RepID=UPI003208442F
MKTLPDTHVREVSCCPSPASRLFPFCTGKYRWHGSAEAYTGREVQDIPGVLAVFAERRKDSFGPYVRLMSVTLN